MTNYNTTISNGTATLCLSTVGMSEGEYDVQISYPQSDKYSSATKNITLNLDEITSVTGDCTDANEWEWYKDYSTSTTPSVSSSGVNSAVYHHVWWKEFIPVGSKLTVTATMSNNYAITPLLLKTSKSGNMNDDLFSLNITKDTSSSNTELNKSLNGTSSLVTTVNTVPNTYTMTVEIGTNNTITIKYDGNTYSVEFPSCIDGFYYGFRKWYGGSITTTAIGYEKITHNYTITVIGDENTNYRFTISDNGTPITEPTVKVKQDNNTIHTATYSNGQYVIGYPYPTDGTHDMYFYNSDETILYGVLEDTLLVRGVPE